MKIKALIGSGIVAGALLVGSAAGAAVTIDAEGKGFVGKGDVQVPFGWSNAQLQQNAAGVSFSVASVSVTDTDWTCSRLNNQGMEQTQERERTTTTETTGVLSSLARDGKKQLTGFNINGFTGTTVTVSHDGPAVGSCPNGWTASGLATGTPVLTSSTSATHGGVTKQIG